jgi:hypothetical protein
LIAVRSGDSGDNRGSNLSDIRLPCYQISESRYYMLGKQRRNYTMKSQTKAASTAHTARQAYRTIEGWAISILTDAHAINACEEHGWAKNRNDPHAWDYARGIARMLPFPDSTVTESLQALDDVMDSIGDCCPECN